MQAPKRMDKVIIEDYYHMKRMDENMNWMNEHVLAFFSLNPRAPFCTSTLLQHYK